MLSLTRTHIHTHADSALREQNLHGERGPQRDAQQPERQQQAGGPALHHQPFFRRDQFTERHRVLHRYGTQGGRLVGGLWWSYCIGWLSTIVTKGRLYFCMRVVSCAGIVLCAWMGSLHADISYSFILHIY